MKLVILKCIRTDYPGLTGKWICAMGEEIYSKGDTPDQAFQNWKAEYGQHIQLETLQIADYREFQRGYGGVKYVQIEQQNEVRQYRFCDLEKDHSTLILPGEKVISAGVLSYDTVMKHDSTKIVFHILDDKSQTLNIGPVPYDHGMIADLMGFQYDSRPGLTFEPTPNVP